jgi:catechol 2,3-dioxygenase-like lactoylglutathione lyase family enzyme
MAQIHGIHHVGLPATDVAGSSDWYQQTFGFACVLLEEEEDCVTAAVLEHSAGITLHLYQTTIDHLAAAWFKGPAPVLSFLVADKTELLGWEKRLTELGIEHSDVRQAHLGWAIDTVGPDGLGLQLHTREEVSVG